MQDETKKPSENAMRDVCEKTRREMLEYAPFVDASLTTLEVFLPANMRVTIIVRKNSEVKEMDLAGAMIRTNDDVQSLIRAMAPLAKAVHEHPTEFQ